MTVTKDPDPDTDKFYNSDLDNEEFKYSPCEHDYVTYKDMVKLCWRQHAYIKKQAKLILNLKKNHKKLINLEQTNKS